MDTPLPTEHAAIYIAADGPAPGHRWNPLRPTAILPGAFNPLHPGHLGLADVATQLLGLSVAFELSIANVDKPDLTPDEVRRRAAQFTRRSALWLTHAPRFTQKAELFPGAVFVVGADTALRVVEPRYYADDARCMHDALARLGACGCRFLVACRRDADGRCIELADLPVPPAFRALFTAIPADRFRLDVSSTEIRVRSPQEGTGA